jgi:hypothetical protein
MTEQLRGSHFDWTRQAEKRSTSVDRLHGHSVATLPRGNVHSASHGITLQRTLGNHAVGRLIQAKLKIGKPDDEYEREADRVAETVMRMPEPRKLNPEEEQEEKIRRKPLAGQITPRVQRRVEGDEEEPLQLKRVITASAPAVQRVPLAAREDDEEEKIRTKALAPGRRCAECEEGEEESLRTKSAAGHSTQAPPNVATRIESMRGGGASLSEPTRSFFESRLGADLSRVRIHTDSSAAEAAQSVNARAFTVGQDIAFSTGEYSPEQTSGKRLLAHELAHTIQQGYCDKSSIGLSSCSKSPRGVELQARQISTAPMLMRRHTLSAQEKAENLRSTRFAGDARLEAAYDDSPAMHRGEQGEAVKKIQQALIDDGFQMPISTQETGTPDGDFGEETEEMVRAFQRKHSVRLGPDGIVGRFTMAKLDELASAGPLLHLHLVYEQKLREAVNSLVGVGFGRAVGRNVGTDPSDRYDTGYWVEQVDPAGDAMLLLKAGKRPSDAVDAMFGKLSNWHVDCAEFIQIAQWYALLHTHGADEFNTRMSGLSFKLKPHGSTGIGTKLSYFRDLPTEAMKRSSDGLQEPKSIDQLIADAPVGSRIAWTNLAAPTSSDFRNENTIKLGQDQFAAHGFGGTSNIFARAEIESNLAHVADPNADATYIAANIFVARIEHYDVP